MAKKEVSYSQALKDLEAIVNRIENEEPDVDELNALVKKAAELIKYCKLKLKSTEEELKKNLEDLN